MPAETQGVWILPYSAFLGAVDLLCPQKDDLLTDKSAL